jgi:choline dehydrogenase-like flavoprotein
MYSSDWTKWTAQYSFQSIRAWANASAWNGHLTSAEQNFTTEAEFDQWMVETARMSNHPTGGATLSPYGADYGVTDPNTAVKGLSDLWIVDASIFVCHYLPSFFIGLKVAIKPFTPPSHTMAPTYIIAERAVDFIRDTYGVRKIVDGSFSG